tara:strand:+ start:83 stop:817 length:735 start_codon:yes stop_codon:yes gene_type:complete
MRKAGKFLGLFPRKDLNRNPELNDALQDFLREQSLNKNKDSSIGMGAYGVVYESDTPNKVMKEMFQDKGGQTLAEANMQDVAAQMGFAPKIAGVETFRGNISNRIEMDDMRGNFERHKGRVISPDQPGQWPAGMDAVRVNQQLGQLALKGIDLGDRHSGNVLYNKMTGRPMQLDFGIANKVEGEMQVDALARATSDGFVAAGLGDVAQIYHDTVYDLLAGGQVSDAMDVAKQGFSRLQKIKKTT